MKDILKTPYNREELINFIIDNSSEEFETLYDVWQVAKETESQLAGRVQNIIDYQQREENDFYKWVVKVDDLEKYELLNILDFEEHYQNLLSYEENLKNFENYLVD